MWCIWEISGIIWSLIGYGSLLLVDYVVCGVGLHDLFKNNNPGAYVVAVLYHGLMFLMAWAHFKCMLTDPGWLPQLARQIDPEKLNNRTRRIWDSLQPKTASREEIKQPEQPQQQNQNELVEDDEEESRTGNFAL